MAAAGLQRSSKLADEYGGRNMEFDNGQSVRSRWHERGCGRRWQSGVTASYGRGTEKDGVQQSEELTVLGRETRRTQSVSIPRSGLQLRESWQKLPSILSLLLCSTPRIWRV
jgi:hypothetical protein